MHKIRLAAEPAAKFFVFLFFLLISDQALVSLASKFNTPIKPAYFYACISVGLLGTALIVVGARELARDKLFFSAFLAIVAIGLVTYRGENIGPSFGAMVLRQKFIPSSASYAVFPTFNLIACAGLYLLARRVEFQRTIVLAAFSALILQVACMEADMWWYALFGDPNGRAAGLAQNANVAALLVVVLASITLRNASLSPYAVILAVAGVLLSQSKTGIAAAIVLVVCFVMTTDRKRLAAWSVRTFATSVALAIAGTIAFSPVLNPTSEQIASRERTRVAIKVAQELPVATLDLPVTLEERLQSRVSIDESAGLRWNAVKFYSSILIDNPSALLIGFGTGFTNKFVTGPHNSFLKLTVDSGILAAVSLFIVFVSVGLKALDARAPQLAAIFLIGIIAAVFYHTIVVDPIVLPALAIGLSITLAATYSQGMPFRSESHNSLEPSGQWC